MPSRPYPCPASEGWQERVVTKTAWAGVGGATLGAWLSVLRNGSTTTYILGTGGSFLMAMACFTALQESVRFLRCEDSPVNSWLAGTGAGYALTAAHQGRTKGVLGGCLWGVAAATCHVLSDRWDPGTRFKRTLASLDLLDIPQDQLSHQLEGSKLSEEADGGWLSGWQQWMPIQKMTDEEYKRYRDRKERELQQ
ncbi:unnamed protein product, partial [Ostreobium quekettii]